MVAMPVAVPAEVSDGADEGVAPVASARGGGGRSRRKRPSLEERGGFRLVKPVNGHKRSAHALDPAYAERLAAIPEEPSPGAVAANALGTGTPSAPGTEWDFAEDGQTVMTLQAWLDFLQAKARAHNQDPNAAMLQVMPLLRQAGYHWDHKVVVPHDPHHPVRLWEPAVRVVTHMFAPKVSPLAAAMATGASSTGWRNVTSWLASHTPGSSVSAVSAVSSVSSVGTLPPSTSTGALSGDSLGTGTAPWLRALVPGALGIDSGPLTTGTTPGTAPALLPLHGPPVPAHQSSSVWWLWQMRQQATCPCGEPLPPMNDEREGLHFCTSCGLCNEGGAVTDKVDWSMRETHQFTKSGHVYQRFTHLRDILNQIQCRIMVPDDMDIVKKEIMRDLAAQRIKYMDQVTYEVIRDAIRKLGYNQNHYYEYIFLLIKQITGNNMYELPGLLEKAIEVCFDQMQAPFERLVGLPEFRRLCTSERHNFLNYFYTVFKICHMYGFQWPLKIQSFVKDVDNIILYEKLWMALCQTMSSTPLFWNHTVIGTWHFVPYEL